METHLAAIYSFASWHRRHWKCAHTHTHHQYSFFWAENMRLTRWSFVIIILHNIRAIILKWSDRMQQQLHITYHERVKHLLQMHAVRLLLLIVIREPAHRNMHIMCVDGNETNHIEKSFLTRILICAHGTTRMANRGEGNDYWIGNALQRQYNRFAKPHDFLRFQLNDAKKKTP